jgi:hypothetical protein
MAQLATITVAKSTEMVLLGVHVMLLSTTTINLLASTVSAYFFQYTAAIPTEVNR